MDTPISTPNRSRLIIWIVVIVVLVAALILASMYTSFIPSALFRSFQGGGQTVTMAGQLKTDSLVAGSYNLKFQGKAFSGQDFSSTTQFSIAARPSPSPSSGASALPDLAPANLILEKTTFVVGEAVTFTGSVKNKGGGVAGASRAAFCLDNSNNNCKNSFDGRLPGYGHDVPTLSGGGHAGIFTATWTATTPGMHTVKLCADVNNDVTEAIETEEDNCLSQSLRVSAR